MIKTQSVQMLVFASVFALLLLLMLLVKPARQMLWQQGFYRASIPVHIRQEAQAPAGAVVLLGDSISQAWWQPSYPWPLLNFSIGGDTAAGTLARLHHYQRLPEASLIVLALGINDLGRQPVHEVVANYQRLLQALPTAVPILMVSVLPVAESGAQYRGYNQKIQRLNAQLQQLAINCARCEWLSMTMAMTNAKGQLEASLYQGDGLHLNAKGYALWGTSLQSKISHYSNTGLPR